MKRKFFYKIISLLLMLFISYTGYGNSQTYCRENLDLAYKEYLDKNYTKSLEILVDIKILAENNNWRNLQGEILNRMGMVYAAILEYEKAIDCYMEAYKIAIKEANKTNEISILNNISHLYLINNDLEKARLYVKIAYEEAVLLRDTFRMAALGTNLGIYANEAGDLDEAKKYLDIAIKLLKNRKDSSMLITAQIAKAVNLNLQKDNINAEKLTLDILDQLSANETNNSKTHCFSLLSRIYQEKGNISQAISYSQEALQNSTRLTTTIDMYEQLSKLYQENGSYILALQYKDSVLIGKDSLSKINDMNQIINSQAKFDLLNLEKKLSDNQAKQKGERTFFMFIIVSISFLAIILILVLRIQSIRNKQRKQIAELELKQEKSRKLIIEQQLKEQENIALLEQERLNNEIDSKNRQFAAKFIVQSSKKELLDNIIVQLCDISMQVKSPLIDTLIRQLKIQLKEFTQWDGFLEYFGKINPIFLSSLRKRHPDLTVADIRFLSYIYLNLEIKEIASLLNISFQACRKKKQRIATKMNIETTELYTYLTIILPNKNNI